MISNGFHDAKVGDSFTSSHFHEVKTFSLKFPDLELCHTIEKTKSFSSAKSRIATASPSENGCSPYSSHSEMHNQSCQALEMYHQKPS